jgi:hypothetical protein
MICTLPKYYQCEQIKENEMGEMINASKILVGKYERKRLLEKPRRRREGNIKVGFDETVQGGVLWIHLARGRDQWLSPMNKTITFRIGEISGSHGGEYEDDCLLGCYAV